MPPFVARKRHRSQTPPSTPLTSAKRGASSSKTHKKNTKTPNLFQEAESSRKSARTLEDNQAFLQEQANGEEDDDESSQGSDSDSDNFENAMPAPASKRRKTAPNVEPLGRHDEDDEIDKDEDDEDEMEWEDATSHEKHEPAISGDLHLTLDEVPLQSTGTFTDPHSQKKGPSKIERGIRINTHCMHVQCLLLHNLFRNRWICDREVQKILVEGLPPGVMKEVQRFRKVCGIAEDDSATAPSITMKGKGKATKATKEHKNQRDWGYKAGAIDECPPNLSANDPTVRLLKYLCSFWRKRFTVTTPGLRKQGYKDLARLEQELKSLRNDLHDVEEHGERVRNVQEFRKLAKSCTGSRDIGAQLFTALLRGIGLECRIVNNLQPVGFGWNKNEDASPKKSKSKSTKIATTEKSSEQKSANNANSDESPRKPKSTMPKSSLPATAKQKSRAGGNQSQPIELSDDESELSSAPESDDDCVQDITPFDLTLNSKRYDRDLPFPVYWSEVFSPIAQTWIPVDAMVQSIVASHPDVLVQFEPRGAKADKAKQVFTYVVAFSADGTAKDVTVRYMKKHMWPGKTRGVRIPAEKVPIYNKKGKIRYHENYDWFKTVIRCFSRSSHQRTPADDIEEARDLQPVKVNRDATKVGGETLQGYKNSAEFVLERHLRREEALLPGAKQVKTFSTGKGENAKSEPVYLRKDVVTCRTAESWHKQGREVKEGKEALKLVPMRAVTTTRKREIEEVERETGEKQKQGLYSRAQTDWIIPPPIKDGVIPKNAFGNMDVYVPTMVPRGGIHIPLRGTAKVCRRLEIDYAEACTGFEFGNRMAVPILTGVVVAKENEHIVIDAWQTEMEEKRKKEEAKREKTALSMWKRMLAGLRVIERVRQEYGDEAESRFTAALKVKDTKKGQRKELLTMKKDSGQETITVSDDEEVIDTGGIAQEDFAMAARGGGGFLTIHDTNDGYSNGGGFSNRLAESGGGFTTAADDIKDTKLTEDYETRASYPRTPMSLKSMQQRGIEDFDKDGENEVDAGSDDFKSERHAPDRKKPKQSAIGRAAKSASTRQPRKRTSAITPPESPEQDDERHPDAHDQSKKPRISQGDKTKLNRTPIRRNAARKSSEAVRSHYFEADTDDEMDD